MTKTKDRSYPQSTALRLQLIAAMQTFTTLGPLVCVCLCVLAPVTLPPRKRSNPNETPEARTDALTSSGRLCCRLQEREAQNYRVVCGVTPDQCPEAHLSSPPLKTSPGTWSHAREQLIELMLQFDFDSLLC